MTAPPEIPLSKDGEATNQKTVAEKAKKRRRTIPSTLLRIGSVFRTKGGGVLIELGPKTINKITFREAVKELLEKNAFVSSLESMSSQEIRDLHCLTENFETDEAIKHECPIVTNVRIGITSVNALVQKLAEIKVPKQYSRKLLSSEKIKIG